MEVSFESGSPPVTAACVDGVDNIVVARGAEVQVYDVEGAPFTSFTIPTHSSVKDPVEASASALWWRPSDGSLLVADASNRCVTIIGFLGGPDCLYAEPEAKSALLDAKLDDPAGVVGFNSETFVSDKGNDCIHVFSPEGTWTRKIGTTGSRAGAFSTPMGLAATTDGNIVVADMDNHRIQVISSEGMVVSQIGTMGMEQGEFIKPTGVAVTRKNKVIVADTGNNRIQALGLIDSTFAWEVTELAEKPLEQPTAVGVASDGDLLVVDVSGAGWLTSLDEEIGETGEEGEEGDAIDRTVDEGDADADADASRDVGLGDEDGDEDGEGEGDGDGDNDADGGDGEGYDDGDAEHSDSTWGDSDSEGPSKAKSSKARRVRKKKQHSASEPSLPGGVKKFVPPSRSIDWTARPPRLVKGKTVPGRGAPDAEDALAAVRHYRKMIASLQTEIEETEALKQKALDDQKQLFKKLAPHKATLALQGVYLKKHGIGEKKSQPEAKVAIREPAVSKDWSKCRDSDELEIAIMDFRYRISELRSSQSQWGSSREAWERKEAEARETTEKMKESIRGVRGKMVHSLSAARKKLLSFEDKRDEAALALEEVQAKVVADKRRLDIETNSLQAELDGLTEELARSRAECRKVQQLYAREEASRAAMSRERVALLDRLRRLEE